MNTFENILENISISFLLLNLGYFFTFRSGDILRYFSENISPGSFVLGVILSRKIKIIKNIILYKINNNKDKKKKC